MLLYRLKYITFFIVFLLTMTSCKKKQRIKVLQFNIWQEGTVVPYGFKAIADEIIATQADLVAFSEVRNYHNTDFSQRIIEELAKRGATFYGGKTMIRA